MAGVAFASETIVIHNFEELNRFFSRNKYTIKKWKEGTQDVPKLVILDIPEGWREKVAPELPVDQKKRIFFRLAIPLVFVANEMVSTDRRRLMEIHSEFSRSGTLKEAERDWIGEMAKRYGRSAEKIDDRLFDLLLEQIDVIPPSLAVAQMADESGWGTSRFAAEGNALFGQWSYAGGIIPEHQRSGKGDYRVEAFKSPLKSVQTYMLNLNSGKPYSEFRKRRLALRKEGKVLTGLGLVGTLTRYSERGEAYVRDIADLIRRNGLMPLDRASLAPGETIFVRLEAESD